MHIHILGICGTFMGSLALLARSLGHSVTGSDTGIYPPMSTQLEAAGVVIEEGYLAEHLQPAPDLVIVGNAMARGNEAVEYMLNQGLRYTSGPQFLSEQVLQSRHVIAVAGTHGKTTTTTMLAWILQYAGIDTGFLIGGVPLVETDEPRLQAAFAHSSHLGAASIDGHLGYFVIEADEYDSAFFDKRSKFVHYRPRTAVLNNLEFDHADIFADLNAIQTQFHHMIRMIPSNGRIIMPANTPSLETTIDKGCWTPIWRTAVESDGIDTGDDINAEEACWLAELTSMDGSQFNIIFEAESETLRGTVKWGMSGEHNVNNALVAVAAAHDIGVDVTLACEALSNFAGIKRRMELIGSIERATDSRIQVFDDFAHHPTAIHTTLAGAKNKLPGSKLWAIIEPRSNTMKLGIHKDSLAQSAQLADEVIWYEPAGLEWGLKEVVLAASVNNAQRVMSSTDAIIEYIASQVQDSGSGNHAIVIMSNGGFEGIHQRLLNAIAL
ncbi:MAG: UDP-N-acetylmuramate:L-alanyl-gamma-D-glutamyl-meso-diaminopimelate ligase [Psychrobacter sp.]|nr:UDP-N-acetylmuramate:L-alanyl-gamma-D-glutamyl-meso-diaminopimelate ligase [Psychrobacter sp.]